MASSDQRQGKEPALVEDKFPEGMRVLAIDNDPFCLKVLEFLLRYCKYQPTMVMDARTALKMLKEEEFDIVITDVHMPDMDGYKLLELIGLEMDLPVIMLSVNEEKETVLKGLIHGACDYLVKPVCIKELKNIWQHVVRKNPGVVNHISSDEDDDAYQRAQPGIAEDEQSGAKSKKCPKKKKNDENDSDENKEITAGVANRKKQRVTWTGELHDRFRRRCQSARVDRAVPKTILQMMNADYLTRESVASHLQKNPLYLKRVIDEGKSNTLSDSSERWNSSSYVMNRQGSSSNYHEHQKRQSSSAFAFRGSNTLLAAPSVLGAPGVSIQSRNWDMGTGGHGASMLRHALSSLPNARRVRASSPPANSFAKTLDHIMLDAFPPNHSGKAYATVLRAKLLEASNVVPSSHPGSFFAEMPNGGMLEPANQFQVQPLELVTQFSTLTNMAPPTVVAGCGTQFPCLVGSSSNPWQNVASSSFPGHIDGVHLAQSQVNIPRINQLPSFATSPGQILPMFQNEEQNQIERIINTNSPTVGFSEQMATFNMASNTTPVEMTSGNFSPMTQIINGGSTSSATFQPGSSFAPTQTVNGGSINFALPKLLAGSSVGPTRMVSGDENASSTPPMQEGPVDLRALDDQPIYSDPFFPDDIFANMLNQDFADDAFFSGEC